MFVYNGWDLLFGVFIGLLIVPFIFTIEWVIQTLIHWLRRRRKSGILKSKYVHAEGNYDEKNNGYSKATGFYSACLDTYGRGHDYHIDAKNENTCVYCGASIPEGRLVCRNCEEAILKK